MLLLQVSPLGPSRNSRHQELASTYLSFTAILANLIWGALFKNRLMNYLFSLSERLAGRKCSGVGCVWLRRGLRIEKSLFGIVLLTGESSESVLFVPVVWVTAQNSNRLSMSWTSQQSALCSGDTDSRSVMMVPAYSWLFPHDALYVKDEPADGLSWQMFSATVRDELVNQQMKRDASLCRWRRPRRS